MAKIKVTGSLDQHGQHDSSLLTAVPPSPGANEQSPIGTLTDIECPLTGEIVDADDVDGLLDLLEALKEKNDAIYAVQLLIRRTLADRCEGDAVTRRIRGERRAAKVVLSDESFEQPILKELWNSHPKLSQECMKIATLSVSMREYKKIVNTSSDQPDFVFFRDAITKANRGRTGVPTVTIEK